MPTLWTVVRRVFLVLLFAFCAGGLVSAQTLAPSVIRVASAKLEFAIAQDYFVGLLKRALELGAQGRPVPVIQQVGLMEQKLGLQEMVRGKIIDVYWMGTDPEREEKLRAIRIPLDRGLVGYRRFITRQSMTHVFDGVHSLSGLRPLVACQGKDWPDTAILRAAGLRVIEIASFERMFQQLDLFKCDYFPRGFFEAYSEINARKKKHPDLILYESLVLHYPFGLYFFVNQKNEDLALWIEQGLEAMIDSGEFLRYMQAHPLTRKAFPLFGSKGMRMIEISNPRLPFDTHTKDSRYWFQPEEFGYSVN
ncbi:MAG TPA: hypothetical protein VGE32_01080 [Cellvibrio sp.]